MGHMIVGNGAQTMLEDLSVIRGIESLAYDDRQEAQAFLRTKAFKDYLDHIFVTKPEEALTDCLFRPLMKALEANLTSQAAASDGWVDFLITNGYGNPVAVELKPLHVKRDIHGQTSIAKVTMDARLAALTQEYNSSHHNQIVSYLKSFEYVILTNMDEVCYFNREAIADFKPFLQEPIGELVSEFRTVKGFWDVVRRKEDRIDKKGLDKAFFADLERWYDKFSGIEWTVGEQGQREAKIVLLNKFIFAQTLEDFGLVDFRFLRETFETAKRKWEVKGARRVLSEFYRDFNDWFYDYYDTELFKAGVLGALADNPGNNEAFLAAIESVLGLGKYDKTLEKGLVHYNYRYIDEDIFGKSYEMFLAKNKKEQGIYYTPKEITFCMAHKLVEELFGPLKNSLLAAINDNDFSQAEEVVSKISTITILDPACGSGSFLVKVLREIYQVYQDINRETTELSHISLTDSAERAAKAVSVRKIREGLGVSIAVSDNRKLLSLIILRHLQGIDVDQRALDVAKVNIWKEAVKLCPDAFRWSTLPAETGHILPDLEMNLVHANTIVSPPDEEIRAVLHADHTDDVRRLCELRAAYLRNPYDDKPLAELLELREELRQAVLSDKALPADRPFIAPVDLFWLYFDEAGQPSRMQGCDGAIGNPPWENIKPIAKEFAATRDDIFGKVSKFSLSGVDFEREFRKALKDPTLSREWEAYVETVHSLVKYVQSRYRLQGSEGDQSFQKVFLERVLELTKGSAILLLPSNFHTDAGTQALREEILGKHCLKELLSFENRGKVWFEDVDSRFKFDIVHFSKEAPAPTFKAGFYIHQIADLDLAYDYPAEDVTRFSPFTGGITEFRDPARDLELARKIRGDHPLLGSLGHRVLREFHMTDDRRLFTSDESGLPLYEGKMIEQYEPSLRQPAYWIAEDLGRQKLLSKEMHRIKQYLKTAGTNEGLSGKDLSVFIRKQAQTAEAQFADGRMRLDYENWRLAYRAIARSTDERTLISTVVPPRAFMGNSLNHFKVYDYDLDEARNTVQEAKDPVDLLYILGLLNSFVLDYYIRLRVSANLNIFFLYELPVPQINQEGKTSVATRAVSLILDAALRDAIAAEAALTLQGDNLDKREARADLEAHIARDIYGLTAEDVRRVLGSFTFGNPDKALMERIIESM